MEKQHFVKNSVFGEIFWRNNFFGEIIKTEWVSGIDIDKKRETEIQSYFTNKTEVHVVNEPDELDSLIETFKLRSHEETADENVNNSFGKNKNWIDLLLWTTFLVLLTFLENSVIF